MYFPFCDQNIFVFERDNSVYWDNVGNYQINIMLSGNIPHSLYKTGFVLLKYYCCPLVPGDQSGASSDSGFRGFY